MGFKRLVHMDIERFKVERKSAAWYAISSFESISTSYETDMVMLSLNEQELHRVIHKSQIMSKAARKRIIK